MSWRKPRYAAVLMGLESGQKHGLGNLISFHNQDEAILWAMRMNEKEDHLGLTKWMVEEIPTKIQYPEGIPRWFTWIQHTIKYLIVCRRRDHEVTVYQSCDRCGENLP